MTPLVSFLLKANLALILLYGFYFLCFRRDTFYGQIRCYLLATMISVIIFPLINISSWLTDNSTTLNFSQYIPNIDAIQHYVFTQPQIENAVEPANVRTIPYNLILMWSWISVAAFLIGRRIFQFECIIRLWRRYPKKQYGNHTIVTVEKDIQPFSFIRYIFLNPSLHTKDELDEIITHELVHCRQGHTLDILLVEILVCLFWFNPLVWLLRYDIKQNIEYYTDRITLKSGFDRKHYQYSLLRVSDSNIQIVNHFHFNNIKKRIIMMNRKESPSIMSTKYLLVFPVLAAVLLTVQISDLQAQESNNKDNKIKLMTHGTSSNKPLIVIDGKVIPNGEVNKIDPANIESVSVLKENTAKTYYGEAGEAGVIIITTKSETTDFSTQARLEAQKRLEKEVAVEEQEFINISLRASVDETENRTLSYLQAEIEKQENDFKLLPSALASFNVSLASSLEKYNEEIQVRERLLAYTKDNSPIIQKSNERIALMKEELLSSIKTLKDSKNFPLYFVDGIEVDEISNVTPNNIESISILKDESATKLYGEKGKNGAVLITTKKQE